MLEFEALEREGLDLCAERWPIGRLDGEQARDAGWEEVSQRVCHEDLVWHTCLLA